MAKKFPVRQSTLILLPLLLIVFAINYHYFDFYRNKTQWIFDYVKPDLAKSMYEEVQKQHPYYPIYRIARQTEKTGSRVYYIFNRRVDPNLDYTSTYFAKRLNPRADNRYLSELGTAINYFFYPRTIDPIYFADLVHQPLKKGDIIIADQPIGTTYALYPRFKTLVYSRYEYFALEQSKIDSFYIYEVIK